MRAPTGRGRRPYREDVHAAETGNLTSGLPPRITSAVSATGRRDFGERVGVHGDLGISMLVTADDHRRYDAQVGGEALRAYVSRFGPGLPIYLARLIEVEVARVVSEQVAAEAE